LQFVDTSFWFGLRVTRDRRHEEAAAIWKKADASLVTTNVVIGESFTTMRRGLGHERAVAFVDGVVESPRVSVHRIEAPLETEAWDWLRRHDERIYSFVDATSFALMRSLGINEALAFDGNFAAAGFTELRV
jgi:predicted nucleic acid-binding protein